MNRQDETMRTKSEKVTGGCLCGAVRYESSEPPYQSGYCHCRMCQKSLGNVVGPYVFFYKSTFRFTRGEPKFYKSSDIAERGFCANCGSPIVFHLVGSDHYSIWIGTLDHPENVQPTEHWGIESQVPWFKIDDDLPRGHTDDIPWYPKK